METATRNGMFEPYLIYLLFMSADSSETVHPPFDPAQQWERTLLLLGLDRFQILQSKCVAVIGGLSLSSISIHGALIFIILIL